MLDEVSLKQKMRGREAPQVSSRKDQMSREVFSASSTNHIGLFSEIRSEISKDYYFFQLTSCCFYAHHVRFGLYSRSSVDVPRDATPFA
jgi:hypothetical protein